MAHHLTRTPHVQLESRWFELEGGRRVGAEIKHNLVGGARRDARHRPPHTRLDRAVQVPAQDALDVRMAGHDTGESIGIAQPQRVHVADARGERGWCMRITVGRPGSFASVWSSQARRASHSSPALAGNQRVQSDEPERAEIHGVLQELAGRQVAVSTRRPSGGPPRLSDWRQKLTYMGMG